MGTGPLPVRGILWAPEASGVGLVGTLAALVSVSFLRGKLEDFGKVAVGVDISVVYGKFKYASDDVRTRGDFARFRVLRSREAGRIRSRCRGNISFRGV